MDQNGHEIPIHVSVDQPIELFIPRDPNAVASPFELQNASSMQQHNRTFNLHAVQLLRDNNLTVSVHLEMHPLNLTRAYWLIYRFDDIPQVNTSIQLLDGWSLLCPFGNFSCLDSIATRLAMFFFFSMYN
jgi:hypothetical protein